MTEMSRRVLLVIGDSGSAQSKSARIFDDLFGYSTTLEVREVHAAQVPSVHPQFRPHIVYLASNAAVPDPHVLLHPLPAAPNTEADWSAELRGSGNELIYLDAVECSSQVSRMRDGGAQSILHWTSQQVPAAIAAAFARSFWTVLGDRLSSPNEAFACARETVKAHVGPARLQSSQDGEIALPSLISRTEPRLPDMHTIPAPTLPGSSVSSNGIVTGVRGWEDVRLLAPHAEVSLSVCGQPELISETRLGAFGLAMRALLVREVRRLELLSFSKVVHPPAHLKAGVATVNCQIGTASGLKVDAILAGPDHAVLDPSVVQLALRHTFTADALSLQMKLPAVGTPPQAAVSKPKVAFGCPTMEVTAITSVWAVNILRGLSQELSYKGLNTLGVAAVGNSPVKAFTATDSALFKALQTMPPSLTIPKQAPAQAALERPRAQDPRPANFYPAKHTDHATLANHFAPLGATNQVRLTTGAPQEDSLEAGYTYQDDDADEDYGKTNRQKRPRVGLPEESLTNYGGLMARADVPLHRLNIPYQSTRAPIHSCTEEDFLNDYCKFCSSVMGRHVTPDTWPHTMLNGDYLDVFHLYKEVVLRGGFGMGNGINWKGQIFPKMRNYSQGHKMTGIGNALKTKYQQFLLDYEQAHPEDLTSDRCYVCGGGEEVSTDWVSCDQCNSWVHFSCDDRPGMGTFKDYAKTDGLSYICGKCIQ